MATTLVISPTTNTMLKIVLYSGYLKPSFLMQVELFAELFSVHCRMEVSVGMVLLYILRDNEWGDEGCPLCNSYIMKGLPWTMNPPWMESKAESSSKQGYTETRCHLINQAIGTELSMLERTAAHGQHGYLPSWCSCFGGLPHVEKTPPRGQRFRLERPPLPLPCVSSSLHPTI